jgi:hypothetical protein
MNAKSIESAGSKVVLVMDSIPYGGDMDPTLAMNLHEDIPCSVDFLLQREDDMVEKQSGGLCSQPSNLCLEDQPFPKVDLPCSVFSRVAGDQTTVGNKEGTGVCVGNPPGLTHPEHGSEEETEPTKAWLIMKYI